MNLPETFPRRILLAVTGLSPQVVTETLYALTRIRQPSFIPTEIHLLTTADGARHAELTLLHPHQGKFERFCRDFGLTGQIRFDRECIHTINDERGKALTDIRTPEENARAADVITALVGKLTSDPECALHVSIAGGRKTMGFYLGYALSLYGRPQDRLSHVLVSEHFEGNHDFYYPPPIPEVLFTRDNKPVNTADAQVTLADIPFVRLRHGLPDSLLQGRATFTEVVGAAQFSFGSPSLTFDLMANKVWCGGREVPMQPGVLAFYAWLARRRVRNLPPVHYTEAIAAELLDEYRAIVGVDAAVYEQAENLLAQGMEKSFFDEKKSRINSTLKRALGAGAFPYLIQPQGKRPLTRFGVGVSEIKFVETSARGK